MTLHIDDLKKLNEDEMRLKYTSGNGICLAAYQDCEKAQDAENFRQCCSNLADIIKCDKLKTYFD